MSHFQLGHFPEALADATKAIEINPGDTSTLWWIPAGAMAGCPDKTFRQAFLALADRAIELLSNQPDTLVQAYLVRSRLHAVLNYPERAQADCGQAVALYIRQLEKQDDAQGADRRDAFQSPNQPTQHYGPTGAIEHDAPVLLNLLQGERKGAMPPDADGLLALLGWTLLEQHQYAEAEMVLRECLAIRTEKRPPSGLRFDTQSMLGGALLGQQRYAEAEPLLRQGYEGLKQYYLHIAAGGQRRAEAAERLVELYEATGEPDKANEWRKKLAEAKASAKTPDKK